MFNKNEEKKIWITPKFFVLDFKETSGGFNESTAEDDSYEVDTFSGPET